MPQPNRSFAPRGGNLDSDRGKGKFLGCLGAGPTLYRGKEKVASGSTSTFVPLE